LSNEEKKEIRKAIVVGINEYKFREIPPLDGAQNDAKEIRDKLIQYGDFDIPNDCYLVGPDATREKILKAVSKIFRKNDACDLVSFYFSGHGIPDEMTSEGYIAPFNYDPDDAIISGINMTELKKAIYNAKNIASTIIILDCCYAGIVTKDNTIKGNMMAPQEQQNKKNLFSINVEKLTESPNKQGQGQGKLVLASSEADAVSREKNNCIHGEHDSPHTHGAFSYHLIEGLEGKAADPDTGIISIHSLKSYVENQMLADKKQKPIYSIAEASNFDNIKIAISTNLFEAKIKRIIKETEDLLVTPPETSFIPILLLQDAAKKVNELIGLKRDHPVIPTFQDKINEALKGYKQPAIKWLVNNTSIAGRKLNEIRENFYSVELPDLFYNLSFNKLAILPDYYATVLFYIFSQVAENTKFEKLDDPQLLMLADVLRAVFDSEKNLKVR
jgi:uncharacterized caspase-like protein